MSKFIYVGGDTSTAINLSSVIKIWVDYTLGEKLRFSVRVMYSDDDGVTKDMPIRWFKASGLESQEEAAKAARKYMTDLLLEAGMLPLNALEKYQVVVSDSEEEGCDELTGITENVSTDNGPGVKILIHPGDVLARELRSSGSLVSDISERYGIYQDLIDRKIGARINSLMASNLGEFFGTSSELWVDLQARYDRACKENESKYLHLVDYSKDAPCNPALVLRAALDFCGMSVNTVVDRIEWMDPEYLGDCLALYSPKDYYITDRMSRDLAIVLGTGLTFWSDLQRDFFKSIGYKPKDGELELK